ncbi:MAG: hypothetical protein R2708_08160 [Vicinamibacterales bacterium]
MSAVARTLAALAPASGLGAALPLPAAARSDPPSCGGYGCESNGNGNGTLYKDKSNLDNWWYDFCSNCHQVQAPRPSDAVATLTRFQQDLVSSRQRFLPFHADAAADRVLRQPAPKARLVPARSVPAPFRDLMPR